MATGVNVKMGVSGVSQFKQNMKAAQTSVTTLDQALKLNEKQFKQTGDAEEYMKSKTELLKVKLEEHKAVIENAEKALKQMASQGVDKSSAAFQRMQQQLLRAKGDLIDTETELENVGNAGEEAANSVDGMNTQLKSIGKQVSFETIKTGLNDITTLMEKAAKTAFNLGRQIVNATLGAGQWADDLQTEADRWGLKPEQLYRMEQTARIIDTDAETILQARKKLTGAMGRESNEDTMGAFAALGLDPSKWHGDVEGLFWKAGEGLLNIEDTVDRNKYAMALFGRSFEDLMPLFKAGRDEYEETMRTWSWVGDEQFQNLTAMDDQYQQMESEWQAFQRQFEAALAPTLTKSMEILTGLFQQLNEYLATPEGKQMLEAMGNALTGLVEDLANIDPESVVGGLKAVFDKLIEGFEWLANPENRSKVTGFIEAFGVAFAGLKGLEVITTVAKLLGALGGLTGGADLGTTVGSSLGRTALKTLVKTVPWLAGASVLLKNAFTPQGNADIWDENGNLRTEELEAARVKIVNGEPQMVTPTQFHGKFSQSQYELLQGYWDKYRTGTTTNEDWAALQKAFGYGSGGGMWDRFTELAAGMYKLDRTMEDLPETLFADPTGRNNGTSEMTAAANNMKGLPAEIALAVENGMSRVKIYIDGFTAGQVLTPYVSTVQGSMLAGLSK